MKVNLEKAKRELTLSHMQMQENNKQALDTTTRLQKANGNQNAGATVLAKK